MQTSLANSIRWPIKDHLHDAIDLLETWHNSGGRPDALPLECRDERWVWASAPSALLTRLALEQRLSTAVLGFPGSPGMLALRWLLDTARLGEVSWKNLKLTDPEFARLIAAAGRLGGTQVAFDPGPWKSGSIAESVGHNGAFRQQAGESVTRSDRQRRELEARSSSPPLARLLLGSLAAYSGNWWSDVGDAFHAAMP